MRRFSFMKPSPSPSKSKKSRSVIVIAMNALNAPSARTARFKRPSVVADLIVHAAKVRVRHGRKSRCAEGHANHLMKTQRLMMRVLHVGIRLNRSAAFGARMILKRDHPVRRRHARHAVARIPLLRATRAQNVHITAQAA
jgi:hypothetical protein